jgi:manganese oxidase
MRSVFAVLCLLVPAACATPRVPGPLLRVGAGTPVHVTLRNTFDRPLVVRGLRDRTPVPGGPPPAGDSVVVPAGGTAEVRFTPRTPGTFTYPAQVVGIGGVAPGGLGGGGPDRPFVGVMIVDPEGVAPPPGERIFILNHWALPDLPASFLPATRFFINGRSWPHTERLEYQQGDTVRWRVINSTGRPHPMHLHGFYFRVDARGGPGRENVYTPEEQRMVVTEVLRPAETMRITWVPTEPGNWVFHCHFMRHMSFLQTAPLSGSAAAHATHGGDVAEGEDAMGGLVLGITVHPGPDWAPADDVPRRRLRLHIGLRDGVFDGQPGYGFVLQEGATPPAADSVHFPGSPIVLTRGEPTEHRPQPRGRAARRALARARAGELGRRRAGLERHARARLPRRPAGRLVRGPDDAAARRHVHVPRPQRAGSSCSARSARARTRPPR